MIVACVLRSGGCYTPEYVERLRDGVSKHLNGHEFVCLSDMDGLDRVPLLNNWPGWWSKIEIFRLKGKVLYFDLDTVITGDLTDIANYPHRFTMLQDFMFPEQLASGVMAWDGDYTHLYTEFNEGLISKYNRRPRWGDQGYISERVEADTFQNLLPGQILSKKIHKIRTSARVVCYHGAPRPHETRWAA